MRLEKCWFCSSTVYPGHGICFVRNDSKTFRFCRSKCHKNFKLKRNPRKVKWTKAFRVLHGKDLSTDSVFKFERKRNRLGRYDRGITLSTLRAMKRVDEVRVRRAQRHFDRRMKGSSNGRLRVEKRELEQQIHIVRGSLTKRIDPLVAIDERCDVKAFASAAPGKQTDKQYS